MAEDACWATCAFSNSLNQENEKERVKKADRFLKWKEEMNISFKRFVVVFSRMRGRLLY